MLLLLQQLLLLAFLSTSIQRHVVGVLLTEQRLVVLRLRARRGVGVVHLVVALAALPLTEARQLLLGVVVQMLVACRTARSVEAVGLGGRHQGCVVAALSVGHGLGSGSLAKHRRDRDGVFEPEHVQVLLQRLVRLCLGHNVGAEGDRLVGIAMLLGVEHILGLVERAARLRRQVDR